MSLRNRVLIGGVLAASVAAVTAAAPVAVAQPGITTPLFSANPRRSTVHSSSVTTGGILEGSALARSGRLSKSAGMSMTANGTTVEFSRPVYLRITVEEEGAKITSTHYIAESQQEGKPRVRLQSSSGTMVFTFFNDSEGKDLLMKIRASDVTYSFNLEDTVKTPATKEPK